MQQVNWTKTHNWGDIWHDQRQVIHHNKFSDEYFWEFATVEDVLFTVIDQEQVNKFLHNGGGFLLRDEPNPVPRFHELTLWAYHRDPKWLTWVNLVTKK